MNTKKLVISIVCSVLIATAAVAQETEIFDIISASGKIIDKRSGKELQVGDKISFQTELEFGSLNDRAVLLNSEKAKYFLELPKSSFVNSQLTIASNQALSPVKNRPALITGTRGNPTMVTNGLSPQTLKEYFKIDTFTVVGSKFTLPVTTQDARKYDLLLRYEIGIKVEEYVSTDFSIVKNDLKMEGNSITECYVLLKEGDKTVPVTQLSIFFVEKTQLFSEFDSLLKALNQRGNNNRTRDILIQYCTDVYGMIDRSALETTINDFFASH